MKKFKVILIDGAILLFIYILAYVIQGVYTTDSLLNFAIFTPSFTLVGLFFFFIFRMYQLEIDEYRNVDIVRFIPIILLTNTLIYIVISIFRMDYLKPLTLLIITLSELLLIMGFRVLYLQLKFKQGIKKVDS